MSKHDDDQLGLRDWFAAHALSAIITATSAGRHHPALKSGENIEEAIARDAYAIADAMLAARSGASS